MLRSSPLTLIRLSDEANLKVPDPTQLETLDSLKLTSLCRRWHSTIRHLASSFITRGVLHLRTLELYERKVLKHAHLKVWPRLSANSVLLAVDEFHLGDILDSRLQQSPGGNADELTALGCLINCRASSIYSTTSGVIDSFLWRLLH